MSDVKLRPCPWCDEQPAERELIGGPGCYCWTEECPNKGRVMLVSDWNTRPPTSTPGEWDIGLVKRAREALNVADGVAASETIRMLDQFLASPPTPDYRGALEELENLIEEVERYDGFAKRPSIESALISARTLLSLHQGGE